MKRLALSVVPLLLVGAASVGAAQQRPAAATVHRVRMLQQGSRYVYEPAGLRVQPGDIVEFVNVSGGPHNVQFYPNRIPAGAVEALNRGMANRLGSVMGPMMVTPNHAKIVGQFLADLREAVERRGTSRGVAARYS